MPRLIRRACQRSKAQRAVLALLPQISPSQRRACLTRRTEKPTSTDSKCFCAVAVRKAFDYVTLAIMALREISGCIEALGEMLARRAVHPGWTDLLLCPANTPSKICRI